MSFHEPLHLCKITGFSAGEEKIKTHPHTLPQIPHICINHINFVSMPFQKLKAGILTEKGGVGTAKYLGLNSPVPWHHVLALTLGQGIQLLLG